MNEHPILFSAAMVQAILDNKKTQTRRVIKPQPYLSKDNPPRFSDTAVGDIFICPDLFPTSDTRGSVIVECEAIGCYHSMGQREFTEKHCPYGNTGDRLWVKEAYHILSFNPLHRSVSGIYLSDGATFSDIILTPDEWAKFSRRKKTTSSNPGMFMYRSLSRISLRNRDVRVELLQDISNEDAIAEGIRRLFTQEELARTTCPDLKDTSPEDYGWYNYLWHGDSEAPASLADDWEWQYSCYTDNPRGSFSSLWQRINAKRGFPWASNPWVWAVSFYREDSNG